MRKLRSERKNKKIQNSLNEFYLAWLPKEKIKSKIENMSKKELDTFINRSKKVIDFVYLELKIEEKYKYYVNLYILYEICCKYFKINNLLKEYLLKKEQIESDSIASLKLNIYSEVAFNEKTTKKITDGLYWLFCSLKKILENYIGKVKPENVKKLTEEIESYYEETDLLKEYSSLLEDKKIKNEIYLLEIMYSRINYAKKNIDLIYSLDKKREAEDEKLKKLIKQSLDRIEKSLECIVKDF